VVVASFALVCTGDRFSARSEQSRANRSVRGICTLRIGRQIARRQAVKKMGLGIGGYLKRSPGASA